MSTAMWRIPMPITKGTFEIYVSDANFHPSSVTYIFFPSTHYILLLKVTQRKLF